MSALRQPSALLSFVAMTLIWGSTWYAIRLQLNGTPTFVSVCLRFLLAAAVLALWMQLAGRSFRVDRRLWRWIPLHGASLYGVNYLFAYLSTEYIVSGLVALAFALNVVFSLLAEPWLLGRRSPRRAWWGAALGIAGLGLVLGPDLQLHASSNYALGIALALAGAAIVGVGGVLSARIMAQGAGPLVLNFYGFCCGALIAGIAALLSGDGWNVVWSGAYVGSLLYLALAGSVAAFAFYLHVVQAMGPVRAGYSSVITPIIALALSLALEGFQLSLSLLAGGALVLLGNYVILTGRQPRPA